MANSARLLAERVQRVLFSTDLMVSALKDEIEARQPSGGDEWFRFASQRSTFDRMQDSLIRVADLDAISIVDSRGRLVTSRRWPAPPVDVSGRDYFVALRDNPNLTYVISDVLKGRLTGQDILILARRVSASDGAFLGVVQGIISTNRFDRPLLEAVPGADAAFHLFLGVGGLAFHCEREIDPGRVISVRIPLVRPVFSTRARVVWCHSSAGGFDLGVEFLDPDDSFRARMVEQVCHIEEYRLAVQREEGRAISAEQAAAEWITKHAAQFPSAGLEGFH